jgi:hypothetical protein
MGPARISVGACNGMREINTVQNNKDKQDTRVRSNVAADIALRWLCCKGSDEIRRHAQGLM